MNPSSEIDIEVEYPKTVYLVDGHPEVFSANGSHGTWGSEGKITSIWQYYIDCSVSSPLDQHYYNQDC